MFAVGRLGEVGAVGFPAEPVPLGREHAAPADSLEGEAQPPDPGEKVDKPKPCGPFARAARIGRLTQLLQPELVDPLAFALHVAPDRPVTHA